LHELTVMKKWSVTSVLAVVLLSPPAFALQPLEQFVRGARAHNPGNREAQAAGESAAAQAGEALGRALPGVSASAAYTRNQREVSFGGLVVTPRDQRDASITLTVPLVDLAKFAGIAAARRSAEAAAQRREATALEVEAEVVQGYYQLAADLALADAAHKQLEAVRVNLTLASEALKAGTATTLDAERASAEVERQAQQLTAAELAVTLAARALESRTGVAPDVATLPALEDDLHRERPLADFIGAGASTPVVRAAVASREAAERVATGQRLALLPAIGASATQRFTNATGFTGGYKDVWAAGISASWVFDTSSVFAIQARGADAAAARAREDATRLAAADAIHRTWSTIDASLARSRSARAQAQVSAHAAEIARTRYRSGLASQLDLIQAERDAFSAEATRIQSDADLLNARLQLRLAVGRSPVE
jgi:outer membrane protein TolC